MGERDPMLVPMEGPDARSVRFFSHGGVGSMTSVLVVTGTWELAVGVAQRSFGTGTGGAQTGSLCSASPDVQE